MGKFTQLVGKFTQSLHFSCYDGRVITGYTLMGKFTQLLHMLCNDSANIKMQQKKSYAQIS